MSQNASERDVQKATCHSENIRQYAHVPLSLKATVTTCLDKCVLVNYASSCLQRLTLTPRLSHGACSDNSN